MATQKQLEQEEIDTITALILTEEAKDPYVHGHSKAVARHSVAIAGEMNLSKERIEVLKRAAILHDIGKVSIADSILNKQGKLNDQEWNIIKKHSLAAIEILKPLKFLSKEKEIILHHHERIDGKGYPNGIKEEAIPLEARIIAVADTFDAMISERAYRKALPHDIVIAELKKVSGSQLDSHVVNIFLNLLEKDSSLWNREASSFKP